MKEARSPGATTQWGRKGWGRARVTPNKTPPFPDRRGRLRKESRGADGWRHSEHCRAGGGARVVRSTCKSFDPCSSSPPGLGIRRHLRSSAVDICLESPPRAPQNLPIMQSPARVRDECMEGSNPCWNGSFLDTPAGTHKWGAEPTGSGVQRLHWRRDTPDQGLLWATGQGGTGEPGSQDCGPRSREPEPPATRWGLVLTGNWLYSWGLTALPAPRKEPSETNTREGRPPSQDALHFQKFFSSREEIGCS